MRLGFLLGWLGVLWTLSAWGGEARVDHLSKRLVEAKDIRLKVLLIVELGSISKEEVVSPLCRALRDRAPLVRQAAVKSLSRLHYFSRLPCLELAMRDSNANVRSEAAQALQLAGSRLGDYFFVLTNAELSSKRDLEERGLLPTVMQVLHSKLGNMGAHVVREKRGGAKQILQDRVFKQTPRDQRYKMQVKASQGSEFLRIEILLMTFPRQSLKASFSVRTRGKSSAKVLERMVQRLLEEAIEEMKWTGE
ncbi:MAG: HEAT repeat domain-containing protein [Proteobacteria bacterium]|nr:HEAT repeat domain-containing protein [Cystobacterineae bacterium]MCL2313869.1 HEAT repeat domain-containing protein [Pseudomonadota bacterium]